MWYIYDEPHAEVLSVEAASRVYELFRRLDPGRPAIMLTNRVSAMLQYHPFCNVLWYDRYPIVATSDELTSLSPIAASVQAAMQTVTPGKPVWPVLQVHDNKGSPSLRKRVLTLPMPSDRTHRPNETEIRAQTHVAIAQGMMAVVYYWAPESWYSMKTDTPGIWRSVSTVLREVNTLEPVLLSNEERPAIDVTGGHDKVMVWARTHEGQIYVGLVNASIHAPAELVLQAPMKNASVQRVLGDGRIEAIGDRVRSQPGCRWSCCTRVPPPVIRGRCTMSRSDPQVTILMGVFNGLPHLEQSIRSILAQTFRDFEFLIIDDASSDGSDRLIDRCAERDDRISVLRNETNLGLGAVLNRGVREARGQLVGRWTLMTFSARASGKASAGLSITAGTALVGS